MTSLRISLALACFAAASPVLAQTSPVLFGVVDTQARYTTNESATGAHKYQLADGGQIYGSRWGVRVREDLGGGLAASALLESGFAPDTGTLLQGGRIFGRQAFIQLENTAGSVRAGRQYTIAHEMMSSYESMFIANSGIMGYQSALTGLRHDNMLRFAANAGPVTVLVGHTFGESDVSFNAKSTDGVALSYSDGPLRIGGVYQKSRNLTAYVGTTIAESTQDLYSIGGTYDFSGTKLYLSLLNSKFDVARYKNKAITVGVSTPLSPALTLIGTGIYDELDRTSDSGKRIAASFVLDYAFSKSFSVYGTVDYTKLTGAWMTVGTSAGFSTPFYANHDTRAGLGLGMRLRF